MLTVRVCAEGSAQTISLSGELDMANAATLSDALEQAEAKSPATITIDMQDLDFIDSTGIAVLVAAHRRLGEGEGMRLVRSRASEVCRVMEVTGLDRQLPFVAAGESKV